MIIRPETKADFAEIYQFIKTAFATAPMSDGQEQDFVLKLRASVKYIPGLALLAHSAEQLLGHIMLTHTQVVNDNNAFPALLLAPVAVAKAYRNRGLGSKLVYTGMAKARDMGHKLVFLLGDVRWYSRFGFVPAMNYNISCNVDIPEEYLPNVMVCELRPRALNGVSGVVDFIVEYQ